MARRGKTAAHLTSQACQNFLELMPPMLNQYKLDMGKADPAAHELFPIRIGTYGPYKDAAEVFPGLIEPLTGSIRCLRTGRDIGLQIDRTARVENNRHVTSHGVFPVGASISAR